MKRREFITLLGGSAVGWPLAAHGQQTDQMRRIGVLMGLDPDAAGAQTEAAALRRGLEEHGWIEGRNLELRFGWSAAAPDLIQSAAKELVGSQCESAGSEARGQKRLGDVNLGGSIDLPLHLAAGATAIVQRLEQPFLP